MKRNLSQFELDTNKWLKEFECLECGSIGIKKFVYERTVANGEVWHCKKCKKEHLFNEQPKEY